MTEPQRLVDLLAAAIAEHTRRPPVLTQADTARALAVPCPLIACSALIDEWCISPVSGHNVAPHQHRLVKAGVIAPPPPPIPADDIEESA